MLQITNKIMKNFTFIFKDSEGNIILGTTHRANTFIEACTDLETVFNHIDWAELKSVEIE